jgi:hypothetical protein
MKENNVYKEKIGRKHKIEITENKLNYNKKSYALSHIASIELDKKSYKWENVFLIFIAIMASCFFLYLMYPILPSNSILKFFQLDQIAYSYRYFIYSISAIITPFIFSIGIYWKQRTKHYIKININGGNEKICESTNEAKVTDIYNKLLTFTNE